MKIAVISSMVWALRPPTGVPHYGGLEVLAYQIAEGLAQKGHVVTVMAPDGSEVPGSTVIPCGPPGRVGEQHAYGGFPDLKEGDRLLRKAHAGYWQQLLKQDVIIDHSWQKSSYLLKMEGRLKAPVLGVCHAPLNTMYQSLPPGVDKPCFVCISQDQAAHFEALFGRAARVAYNGIDPDYYRPLQVPRTDRWLFCARFSTIKGPDLSIQACNQAGVGLDLVGDTTITQEPEYLNQCRRLCDGSRVRFVGPATRGETVGWYSKAHAFLHPNQRFREPLGLAPLEAMSCGLPVVAWRYGALRETVKEGETGYLVDNTCELAERVKQLSAAEAVSPAMRAHCRDWAAQWSVVRMVTRYDQLCTEAVDTGGW